MASNSENVSIWWRHHIVSSLWWSLYGTLRHHYIPKLPQQIRKPPEVSVCYHRGYWEGQSAVMMHSTVIYDDVIKWKHFLRYWPLVWGIHRSPVNSPHKGQWRGALVFSLICTWFNGWVNNREAGDLRRHHAHCDVIVMKAASFIGSYDNVLM